MTRLIVMVLVGSFLRFKDEVLVVGLVFCLMAGLVVGTSWYVEILPGPPLPAADISFFDTVYQPGEVPASEHY